MNPEFWISIGIGAVGVAFGIGATLWAGRRLSHRPRLKIGVTPRATIVPQELDIEPNLLRFFVKERQIYNLCLLHVELRLDGFRDIILARHDSNNPDRTLINPFIQFTDFQILALHTLNNDESAFYIPLARSRSDTRLHINFQRMKAGTIVRFQILGTLFRQRTEFTEDQAALFPGTLPDVDVSSFGLIQADHLRSTDA